MIEAALAILVLLALVALFILIAIRHSKKFSELDEKQFRKTISQLFTHGRNYETLNFDEVDGDAFVQFKKYIDSEGQFGVDLVFPIVGRYAEKEPQVRDTCKNLNLHLKMVRTKKGWLFAFIGMSGKTKIIDQAVTAAIELAEIDFSKNVGVSTNSTFKWRRKEEVLGRQKLLLDEPSRFDISPNN